jgi:hypothetical protein
MLIMSDIVEYNSRKIENVSRTMNVGIPNTNRSRSFSKPSKAS